MNDRAARAGFERGTLDAGGFVLTRYLRASGPTPRLVVYLEGDAAAWHRDGRHVTADPPPMEPLALRLAGDDPAPAVAWLGRPCQPVADEDAAGCEPSLWSHGRFSEPVVAALDEGLNLLLRDSGARELELIGYSGGGILATLLAARREDVARLVTMAAPLDLDAWIEHHGLGPLDATDPARLDATSLADLPQWHLTGDRDATVPPDVLAGFMRRHPTARLEVVPRMGHGGWADGWAERIAALRRNEP
ncbi:MAG: alpha/beta hydrolase [Deltaproteobacteria bacterium]|nr:alpha/beta hydrolase [Deltaproteobacteria bacterium]